MMIDPGKLYDWLQERNIEIIRWDDDGSSLVSRQEFGELFRVYIEEVTSR